MNIDFHDLTSDATRAQMSDLMAISADVSPWREAEFLYELPQKWSLSFTAHTDKLVGYCILSHKFSGRTHIHQFMVSADMRGRQVGRAMLREALDRTGIGRTLSLKVHKANTTAQQFYLQNGFRFETEDGDYLLMLHNPGISVTD